MDSGGARLMVMDVPGGSPQRLGSVVMEESVSWSEGGRWALYPEARGRRMVVLDLQDQHETFLAIPDSLGASYQRSGISPDGREALVSTIRRTTDWGVVVRARADGSSWTRIPQPFGESEVIAWRSDGWAYLSNHRGFQTDFGGEPRLELWRVHLPDGPVEFVAPIPDGCDQVSISRDARRAACRMTRVTSDLMVVDGFDATSD
jgi:hypothetical protein